MIWEPQARQRKHRTVGGKMKRGGMETAPIFDFTDKGKLENPFSWDMLC